MAKTNDTEAPEKTTRVRLDYLDGLRGLAALYVVFAHLYMTITNFEHGKIPLWLIHIISWLSTGRFAVDVFIVLSGYSLMLPVVRATDRRLAGGLSQFFKRRAGRILPPYYAALFVVVAVSLAVPGVFPTVGIHRGELLSFLGSGNFWSHLFLVQNFSPDWTGAIDYPTWTIATEWQIYFVFALVLLPLWRKAGLAAALLAALGIGIAVDRVIPWAFFHFIVPFALGMAAAVVGFSPNERLLYWRDRLPWGGIAVAIVLPLLAFWHWKADTADHYALEVDCGVGIVSACLLISCTRQLTDPAGPARSLALRILKSRAAVTLGAFSYSLYLTHALILAIVLQALPLTKMSVAEICISYFALGSILSLLFAYGFHLLFERPFMPGRPRTERQAEQAAIVSPAP